VTRRRFMLLTAAVALGSFLWWSAQPAVDDPHPPGPNPTEVSP
jgi:hypothetical protein